MFKFKHFARIKALFMLTARWSLVGIVAQCIFIGMLSAAELRAQDLNEVKLSIPASTTSLGQLIFEVESHSTFKFSYNEADIDLNANIPPTKKRESLYNILQSVANELKIQFRQINETIFIQMVGQGEANQKGVLIGKDILISGLVKSSEGDIALPGVNVVIKGTREGTITDVDGKFSISVVGPETVLVFSYLGHNDKEVRVGTQTFLNVTLEVNVEELQEVVVVGYGSTLKKDFVGSVVTIDREKFAKIPSPSADQALQGLAAGVQVQANSGTPGGGIKVLIRGQTSINASNDPLYIVDGVPILANSLGVTYLGGETQSPLVGLNPNDIESISILKDASSTAIYGARAANGVVLIKTKKGAKGKTQINFSGYSGWTEEISRLDVLNRDQYIEVLNEARSNSGDPLILTAEDPSQPGSEFFGEANEDWLDHVLRRARLSEYQFNVSGGAEKTTFYFSSSYRDQEGVVIGTRLRRGTMRLNMGHEASEYFRINSSLSFSRDENQRVYENNSSFGPYGGAIGAPPTEPVYTSTGAYNFYTFGGNNGSNAVANGLEGRRNNLTNKFIANINFAGNPIPDLVLKADFSLDFTGLKEDYFDPSFTGAARTLSTTGISGLTNRARRSDFESLIYAIEPTATYTKNFGTMHKINAVVGATFQESTTLVNTFIGEGIPGNNQISYFFGLDGFGSSSKNEYAFNSLFGRVNYSLNEKYLASVTLRRDGSSRLGPGNRFGLFWAASAGWNFSDEIWFDQWQWLSFGKLRAGYGVTGNDQIGDYQFVGGYGAVEDYFGSAIGPLGIGNPNLKWEQTSTADFGIELGLLEDRITFNAGYFDSETKDLLFRQPVTGKTGFNQLTGNIGNVSNKGWEFEVGGVPILRNKLSWNVSFNIAFLDNLVTKLVQPVVSPETATVLKEGYPIGALETFVFTGVDVNNGNAIYKDINGNGSIGSGDETLVGSAQPDYYGGLSNSVTYGQFNLDFLVNFSVGQEIYNVGQYIIENRFNNFSNYTIDVLDRWQQPGDVTSVPRIYNSGHPNTRISSRYISDGSFVRLRNVTLSYNFPPSMLSRIKLSRASCYVTGSNLLTWTAYKGLDPEVNGFAQNTTGPGGVVTRNANILIGNDFLTPPQNMQVIFGINIGI